MKKYDALYIFVGVAKEDAVEAQLTKALAEVERVGGKVLEQVIMGAPKGGFARPMKKHSTGVYVKVRMELDPAKVDELVKRYKLVEEVFRVQILAVNDRREAKLAAERAMRAERAAKLEAEKAEALAAQQAAEAAAAGAEAPATEG